ncbi:MAG: nucleoside recognition protein [Desulfosoma sp.]|uniref:nucleoside recognition protein n=1 Tax=Desulfosoma sp. TaxID=2603217 RepID=UPI004049FC7F
MTMSSLSLSGLISKTFFLTAPVLLIMAIGLAASEILWEMGLLRRLGTVGKPLSRFARLPETCAVAVITSLISPTAANTMLQSLRENKILTDRQTYLASLLNGAIVPVKEVFTYQLPVVLPALGAQVGLVYIGTLWLGALVLFLFVIVCGRLMLSRSDNGHAAVQPAPSGPMSLRRVLSRCVKRFGRIATIFLSVTLCVFVLMDLGILARLERLLSPAFAWLDLSPIVLPSIATYVISPLVGTSMLGTLVRNDLVDPREAIVALLFGSVFMLPLLYMRFYLPQWVAIFGLRLGVLRALTSATLIMATRLVVLVFFLW